jgi:TRAP-type C4-dicarboxylate transport system substrate-binding protein
MKRALIVLAVGVPLAAHAEPVVLKFGNPGPNPSVPNYTIAQVPFAEAVTRDSDGALEVKLFPGTSLATNANIIDRLKNGVAEIGTGLVGLFPDLFPRTTVAMLPFESDNPHEAGVALMKVYEAGLLEGEMRDYKVLSLGLYANMSVHSKRSVTKLEDLKGQKIAVMSRTMGEVLERLGATPITMPPADIYSSAQRGTVDAVGIGWPGFPPFKLQEVVSHHVQTSLTGEGNYTLMLKSTYDKLPAKAKASIDKHGGMPFALLWAKAIQAMDDQGLAIVKAANQPIVTLAPDEEARWKERAKPVVDAWVANTPDGAKVLAAYRAEIAKVRAASPRP